MPFVPLDDETMKYGKLIKNCSYSGDKALYASENKTTNCNTIVMTGH